MPVIPEPTSPLISPGSCPMAPAEIAPCWDGDKANDGVEAPDACGVGIAEGADVLGTDKLPGVEGV